MSDEKTFSPVDAIKEVNVAFTAYKEANEERLAQIEAKGAADPVTEAKLAAIDEAINKAQKSADEATLASKRRDRFVTDENGQEVDLEAKARNFSALASNTTGRPIQIDAAGVGEYKAAMDKLMRSNFSENFLSEAERKTLSSGLDSSGGYLVEPDMSGRFVKKVFETSAVRAYAAIQTISTNAFEGYYDNDEVGFGWVAEMEARPATATPSLGKWSIPVHEMYAMPEASQTILDDAMISLESWLDGKISDKFSRAENAAFVAGNGINKPRGFLDYPTGTDLTNSIEQVNTGANGAFVANPNGGDVLITALYSLKAQYKANANWFMNRTTAALTRKLKDSNGAYIWAPGIAAGQPASLLGYPIAPFEDMPNPATGSLSIAVGDMREAYQIVDRLGIRMLRDPFSAKPKIQFYATKRTGGDMINGEALKIVNFQA
jgi:HK97 family phage major capsid protein